MNTCRSWHCLHSNVRRSTRCALIGWISLIEVSPPHAGHSATAPRGADRGACTLYPLALEGSASPWKVQVRLGRLMASRWCSSLDALADQVCAIWNTSPTIRTRPSTGFLLPLEPEFFRKTARLAREREVLERPSEQNWHDAGNNHFCSALGTCRRGFFGWLFFASHVTSFHARLLGASPIGEGSPIRRGLRPE